MLADITIAKTESDMVPDRIYYSVKLTFQNGKVVTLNDLIEMEFNALKAAGVIPDGE